MASVAIRGGTLKRVMISPLMPPARVPARSARTIATASGRPRPCQRVPSRIAVRPRIEPTDRSMPPVTITKVMAKATRLTSAIRRPWFKRLSSVKK